MKLSQILQVKKFEKWLQKEVGRRCPGYAPKCYTCRGWKLYATIHKYVEDMKKLDRL